MRKRPIAISYPETDDMGEHEIQRLIAEVLRPLIERFLLERGRPAHVGADQFIYWEEGTPTRRIAPDVYVLPGVDRGIAIRSWKTWESGIVPSFALEIVGSDIAKDYEDSPAEYASLGVEELVVFDPHATPSSKTRVRWQVFRRISKRGLVRVDVSNGDRVKSRVLKAWLRAVGSGDAVRIRIAEGERGDQLFPTEAEAERAAKDAERAAKEAERAAKEVERAAKEVERAAKEAEREANRILRDANENERRARRAAEEEVARLKLALERARRSKR